MKNKKGFHKAIVIFIDILGSRSRNSFEELYEINELFHTVLLNNAKQNHKLDRLKSHCLQNKQSVKFSINSAFFIEMCYNKYKKIIKRNKKACT